MKMMMILGKPLRLALIALAAVSGIHAEPLKFEVTPPGPMPAEESSRYPFDPGRVRTRLEQLWQGDKLIFEAKVIDSHSLSGHDPATWAISAVTGDLPPMSSKGEGYEPEVVMRDGKPFLNASPREIWIVPPDGKPRRLSKPDMDATDPVISPDGRFVAFTACRYDANNHASEDAIYIVTVDGGDITEVLHKEVHDTRYFPLAKAWSSDSHTLTVKEEWGENSHHEAWRKVTLVPEH